MKLTKLCFALVMTVSLAGAPKPKPKLTREAIIQSCITPLSFQERSAFSATKTKLEAAQLLQSLYQDRLDYWERRCVSLGFDFRTDPDIGTITKEKSPQLYNLWVVPANNAKAFDEALTATTALVASLDKK